ncbi:unnamed protein product, partial [Staurois parvus]
SCCCQVQSVSWVPVPLSGLLTLWWVPFCHRVLADYGPPIAAARPVICHGPPVPTLMLLLMLLPPHAAAQSLSWAPVRPPMLLSPSPTLPCHFQVSSHCWWVHFVIGCWQTVRASHCC